MRKALSGSIANKLDALFINLVEMQRNKMARIRFENPLKQMWKIGWRNYVGGS